MMSFAWLVPFKLTGKLQTREWTPRIVQLLDRVHIASSIGVQKASTSLAIALAVARTDAIDRDGRVASDGARLRLDRLDGVRRACATIIAADNVESGCKG
eukprot:2999110-Pleurochrysis_carterae.AAC.2